MYYVHHFSIILLLVVKFAQETSMTVIGTSSVFPEGGPEYVLTPQGFWHSDNEDKPWIALELPNFVNDVILVEVQDRNDNKPDWIYARFENVEVSVVTDSDINTQAGKTSCGTQSYQGQGIISYK